MDGHGCDDQDEELDLCGERNKRMGDTGWLRRTIRPLLGAVFKRMGDTGWLQRTIRPLWEEE